MPPPTNAEYVEILRLLRVAETRAGQAVTHGDLDKVTNTIMKGMGDLGSDLRSLSSTVNVHGMAIDALGRRVSKVEAGGLGSRRPSPMPRAYNPEETSPGGGLRVAKDEWEAIQALIAEHEEKIATAEREKHDEELKREAAERVIVGQKKVAAAKRKNFLALSGVAVPVLIALGSVIAHFLHL